MLLSISAEPVSTKEGIGAKLSFDQSVIERRRLVVVQIVEHLHADKGHGVGLLRDGGRDAVFLDPLQRFRVRVHRHHNLAGDVVAVEHSGHFLPRLRLQAHEGIDLIFFFADDLGGGIEGDARIALNVDHARDLDAGVRSSASR